MESIDPWELRQAASDLWFIQRNGNTLALREWLRSAADDWRRERSMRTVGYDLEMFFLGRDLAEMTGLPKASCDSAAREVLDNSYARMIVRELREFRRAVEREMKERPGRARGAA